MHYLSPSSAAVRRFALTLLLCILGILLNTGIRASAEEQDIVIHRANTVADTFRNVDALYRPGGNDGSDSTYSCASYVKRFYAEVYGVNLNNMFANATPHVVDSDDFLEKVTEAVPGDIVREKLPKSGSTHWSIVKEIKDDGSFVIIEQNYKWRSGSATYARIGRTLEAENVTLFRLHSQLDAAKAPEAVFAGRLAAKEFMALY